MTKPTINGSMKSILAALIAGLGSLQTALLDDTVTGSEWVAVVAATVAALGFVYGVSNEKHKLL